MMSNNDFDKGAALAILRYTAKIAAAPAVGGQAGPPAADPGPLNPTGGVTQGGSNNPQMQTGWAAGAMRKSLVKRFTANASRRQRQPIGVAASKQVGGMGSGIPKVAVALIPLTGMQKLSAMEKEASLALLGRGAAWGAKLFRGFGAAARAGVPLRSGARRASTQQAARTGGGTLDDVVSKIIDPKTNLPFSRAVSTSVPRGASSYTEPVREGIKRFTGRGSGFSNIYKHKETGKLIKGPKGFFAKGRAPKGYALHKPWTQTGGYLVSRGKKLVSYGAKGGLVGYGGSYLLNPGKGFTWKNLTDKKRLRLALGGATLGASFSSLPAAVASFVGPGAKVIDRGQAAGAALARGKGGINPAQGTARGGSFLDILTGTAGAMRRARDASAAMPINRQIKALDKINKQKRLDKQIKKSTKGDQVSIRQQFNLDEGLKSTRGRPGVGTPKPGASLARLALAKSKGVVQGTKVKAPKAGVLVGNRTV